MQHLTRVSLRNLVNVNLCNMISSHIKILGSLCQRNTLNKYYYIIELIKSEIHSGASFLKSHILFLALKKLLKIIYMFFFYLLLGFSIFHCSTLQICLQMQCLFSQRTVDFQQEKDSKAKQGIC